MTLLLAFPLLPAAVARLARLAPHFAAAAAAGAGARHVQLERHHHAGECLVRRNRDLGVRRRRLRFRLDVIAAEQFARRARRREINRDFVGKRAAKGALVRHERLERNPRRIRSARTKHLGATIEAALQVVKKMPPDSAGMAMWRGYR